jgi:transposase InsO family protein
MRILKEECVCLKIFEFFTGDARRTIEARIRENNTKRPHQELGYLPLVEFGE